MCMCMHHVCMRISRPQCTCARVCAYAYACARASAYIHVGASARLRKARAQPWRFVQLDFCLATPCLRASTHVYEHTCRVYFPIHMYMHVSVTCLCTNSYRCLCTSTHASVQMSIQVGNHHVSLGDLRSTTGVRVCVVASERVCTCI